MGIKPPIFHDEYTEPRWIYASLLRPVSVTTMPAGMIIGSVRKHERYYHGTVDYARRLTKRESEHFDLRLIGTCRIRWLRDRGEAHSDE